MTPVPSMPPPYDSVSGPVAAVVAAVGGWAVSHAFILACCAIVGSAPCRYGCPYCGEYGLAAEAVVAAAAAEEEDEAIAAAPVPSARAAPAVRASAARMIVPCAVGWDRWIT